MLDRAFGLEQVGGTHKAVAVIQVIFDELPELRDGGAFERLDDVPRHFGFIAEEGVEEEGHEGIALAKEVEVDARDRGVGGADEILQCGDHRMGAALNCAAVAETRPLVVAIDAVGAGLGEVVLYASGSSARQTRVTKDRPVDATIMAIVDSIELEGRQTYIK